MAWLGVISLAPQTAGGQDLPPPLRVAVWNVDLERRGPGLLLAEIAKGQTPQIHAVRRVIAQLKADVLLLNGFDYDHGLLAAQAFNQSLAHPFAHVFAYPGHRGRALPYDLNGDGHIRTPEDAQSWGRFEGQAGMLLLSNLALDHKASRDLSGFLWADLPEALWPETHPQVARSDLRLATTGMWDIALIAPDRTPLHLLAYHASPPAFEGAGRENTRRNHDETRFWTRLLDHDLPIAPPKGRFILLGTANLDPLKGAGERRAMIDLLAHPALQDPYAAHADADTVVFQTTGPLRSEIALPSAEMQVKAAGVLRPPPELSAASRHFPVWLDLEL